MRERLSHSQSPRRFRSNIGIYHLQWREFERRQVVHLRILFALHEKGEDIGATQKEV
jgi:hypothetical protein